MNLKESMEKGLLTLEKKVYKDKRVFQQTYIPSNLLIRDSEAEELGKVIVQDRMLNHNCSITGPAGSGKTITLLYVYEMANKIIDEHTIPMSCIYVLCSENYNYSMVMTEILTSLNIKGIPSKGWVRSMYMNKLRQAIGNYESIVICLDEIDRLVQRGYEDVIWNLVDIPAVSLICISNIPDWHRQLDPRILSRLQLKPITFSAYIIDELFVILKQRVKEGLKEDIIDDSTLMTIARRASDVYGDARKAIDLLAAAIEISIEKEQDRITEDIVSLAEKRVETLTLYRVADGLAAHQKIFLIAIANQIIKKGMTFITNEDAYSEYYKLIEGSKKYDEGVSKHQLYEYLKQFELYSLIESRKSGLGRGRGSIRKIYPLFDPRILIKYMGISR